MGGVHTAAHYSKIQLALSSESKPWVKLSLVLVDPSLAQNVNSLSWSASDKVSETPARIWKLTDSVFITSEINIVHITVK